MHQTTICMYSILLQAKSHLYVKKAFIFFKKINLEVKNRSNLDTKHTPL
jgi:hypothetical protein